MSPSIMLFVALTSCIAQCFCAPQTPQAKSPLQPLMQGNFPDPAFIEVDNIFYAFSTQSGGANVPIATSPDLKTMALLKDEQGNVHDAMKALPPWTTPKNPSIWAPDVIQLPSGDFVLYFSAASNQSPGQHCIGAATSTSVTGPFTPVDTTLACPLDQGGAIDPAGFVDADGKVYVVYKVDGNSQGGGGPCGNANGEFKTPLMLQEVSASDGYTPIGDPTPLIDRDEGDGPLVEAPSLVRSADGTYVLFFSSNCYNTKLYDSSYATAASVKGPYSKSRAPLLTSGFRGLLSPGGTDVLADGSSIVFHGDLKAEDAGVRQVFGSRIRIDGTTVSLV